MKEMGCMMGEVVRVMSIFVESGWWWGIGQIGIVK